MINGCLYPFSRDTLFRVVSLMQITLVINLSSRQREPKLRCRWPHILQSVYLYVMYGCVFVSCFSPGGFSGSAHVERTFGLAASMEIPLENCSRRIQTILDLCDA